MFGFKKKSAEKESEKEPERASLSDRLQRTRSGLFGGLFSRNKTVIDNTTLEELEDRLIMADIGTKTTDQVITLLKAESKKNAEINPLELLKQVMLPVLQPVEQPLTIPELDKKPYLILVIGVNGVGKTTTIGKLAKRFQNEGKKVMLAAGDTFRAAAIEQLQVWGERNKINVVAQTHGSDSGAVIFDALESARANNIDVLIADTAGRLHNKDNLMEEMKKIHRIGNKFDPDLEKEVLLVLDAGTGQNALVQAKQFNESIGISGIVLTKLDGTAKGGIVFSLADELNIPVRFIGVGEQVDDLRPFNASEFIDALLVNET
ncbi:MAG: signal recognition particle-docking protein FtsY [Proteobacteria bacterium]|nr:signal recognition particle-docking protein FtsY [Pseudomonadota bacterium]NOG60652.1 signal recognition particle-docking protein FtsY [Pseudomonadota bacterium]